MGFWDMFRRAPAIWDIPALDDFIDRNAAFLIQKGMYEYSRARAGHYAKVLMREPEFLAAIETSRWKGFPLGLAMVGEMVEGKLRPAMGGEQRQQRAGLDALMAMVMTIFDRYPVPPVLEPAAWEDARTDLSRRLDQIGLHPPKLVKDIPVPFAEAYFGLMPIHEKLRAADFPAIRNYLRVSLINIHDELDKRLDVPPVAQALLAERAGGQTCLSPSAAL
ncbi:MAG: hypothetical protein ACRECO_20870 [Xanthobacteraceae bacterium]